VINEKYTTIKLWERKNNNKYEFNYNPYVPTNLNRLYVVLRSFIGFTESVKENDLKMSTVSFPIKVPVICSLVCLGKDTNEQYYWRFQTPSPKTGDYAIGLTPIMNGDKWIGLPIEW
jgi:hypothetical protein